MSLLALYIGCKKNVLLTGDCCKEEDILRNEGEDAET